MRANVFYGRRQHAVQENMSLARAGMYNMAMSCYEERQTTEHCLNCCLLSVNISIDFMIIVSTLILHATLAKKMCF